MSDAAPARLEIRVEDLHKSFGSQAVLRGVDLEVPRGNLLALVGGSGCGKTVLLDHVLGQLTPDRGRVWVADHGEPGSPLRPLDELEADELDRLHTYWGVVFQRNALFSGSVLDNIALWLQEVKELDEEAIETKAREVLAAVGLPTGDEFLHRDHEQLSGGMAKRLAVARALAMDPLVMFYDEPTTGLDPVSAGQIHELILCTYDTPGPDGTPRTTLIITHDKDLLRRLEPRVVMLHEGRVYFDGPYRAFERSDSPIIRPYFEMMPVLHACPRAAAG